MFQDTQAQRSVRHCLDMLAPFEASEPQREAGQRQFYHFMVSIYRGMCENPEDYLVFPAPYEEYMVRRRQREAQSKKEREHVSDSRESTLRNTFQQAIQFYAAYFYQVGLECRGLEGESGALIIGREEYNRVLSHMGRIHGAEYNNKRYQVLFDGGLEIREDGQELRLVHREYPRAMEGVLYLCKAPDSRYRWMNFLRLDYRNAYAPAPTVADICRTLPKESALAVERLEKSLAGMRIKVKIRPLRGIVSDFKWKVEYVYKGQNICGFYGDNRYFMLCVYFNRHENISEFAGLLQRENQELFAWFKEQFPQRLCKCPSNRRVCFGGEYKRICGLSNRAEIGDPSGEDVEKALYILKKYRKLGD